MVKERQTSFAQGELSPTLWGRSDLPIYAGGSRTLLNFIVTPHGVLTNRTGSQHIADLPGRARLIPFVYPDDDPAMLILTHRAITIIGSAASPRFSFYDWGDALPSEYVEDDLHLVKHSQIGAVMTLTARGYSPIEISRGADNVFSVAVASTDVPDFPDVDDGDVAAHPPGLYFYENPFGGDSSGAHPPRPWQWQVTRVMRQADGTLYESAPYTLSQTITGSDAAGYVVAGTIPSTIALYSDWVQTVYLWVSAGKASSDPNRTTERLVAHRVYRGREGRFGFIGETKGDRLIDDGTDPDFSVPPPQEFNPFNFYDTNGNLERVEYPSLIEYHELRRFFAATSERPNMAWGSKLGDMSNYDEIIPAQDDAALSFQLTTQQIRQMVGLEKLLMLTSRDAYLAGGSGVGEILNPNSIAARKIGHFPAASEPAALRVDDVVVYPSAAGVAPRIIMVNDNGVREVDIAWLAKHLFDGFTVVDWAFARHPHSVLWVVRSDGVLLSLTYVPERGVTAWARHELSGDGLVESVAVRPEDGEDGVYLVVNHDGTRYLERLAYKNLPLRETTADGVTSSASDVRYAVHLDRSVSYNGKWSGIEHAGGASDVRLDDHYGSGGVLGGDMRLEFFALNATPIDVGSVIQIDDPTGGRPYRLRVTDMVSPTQPRAQVIDRDLDASMIGATFTSDEWYLCATGVNGLEHLGGQTVTALADGNVYENLTVAGGGVSLGDEEYAAIIHVGLPYSSDFESLASHGERGRQKIVERALLELEFTRGGSIGSTLDDLKELRVRQVSDAYGAAVPRRENVNAPIAAKWADEAYVAFRQSDPLPATILGITREIKYGG